jgi:hypothetical protein
MGEVKNGPLTPNVSRHFQHEFAAELVRDLRHGAGPAVAVVPPSLGEQHVAAVRGEGIDFMNLRFGRKLFGQIFYPQIFDKCAFKTTQIFYLTTMDSSLGFKVL